MVEGAGNGSEIRILIAEDEMVVAEDLAMTVQDLGYQVAGIAATGEEAVRLAYDTKPALVMMDIRLAGEMDGIQVSEKIRSRLDVPCIFITAHDEKDVLSRAKRAEPYGYIAKPFPYNILKITIETALYKHAADKRVRESEERFQFAMEASTDGIWDWDIPTGVTYYSPGYFSMLGLEAGDYPQHFLTWLDLVHPEDRDYAWEVNQDCIRGMTESFAVEFRMRHKDGTWRWILGRGKSVARDADGIAVRMVGTHTDITARKEAAESLRQSEERFRMVYESGMLGMGFCEPSGRILDTNDAYLALIQRSREDLLNNRVNWRDITPREHLSADLRGFDELAANGRCTPYEKEYLLPDGTRVPVIIGGAVLPGSPSGAIAFALDITERKKAEEALRESEERYRSLFDNMLDGVAYCKMLFENGRPQDFVYLHVNDTFAGLTNLKNVTGKRVTEVIPGIRESNPELFEIYGRVALGGKPEKFETYIDSLGTWFSVSVYSTEREYFAAVFENITDRKMAEEEIRRSEERLELALRGGDLGLWDWDIKANKQSFNERWAEMLGYSLEDITPSVLSWERLVHPDDLQRSWESMSEHLEGVSPSYEMEQRLRAKSGDWKWILSKAKIVERDENGRPLRVTGTHLDITSHKEAEEALRESQEKLRLITATIEDVFWMTSPTIQEMIYVSPAYERIWGRTCQSLYESPKSFMEHVHPEDRGRLLKVVEDHPHERWTCEYRIVRPNGTVRWIHDRGYPIMDQSGNLRLRTGVASDITDHKNTEEALQASEDQYRDLVENIEDLICTHDLQGNLLFVNTAPARVLGYSPEDLVGTNLRSYLAPEVRDEFDAYLAAIHRDGRASGLMLLQTRTGQKRIWEYRNTLRTEGVAVPTVRGIARDITDRKRSEDALRESEDKFRHLFESASVGKSLTFPTGEINVNKAFCDLLGYTQEELRNKTWHELTAPEDIGTIQEMLDQLLNGDKDSARFQKRYIHKNGSYVWADVSCAVRRDHERKPLYFVTTIVDVTDSKKAEEELRKSEEFNRLMVQHAPMGIIYLTVDGAISFTNPACNRIFGVPEDQPSPLVGQNIFQLPLIADQPRVVDSFEDLIRKGRPQSDIELFYRSPLTSKDYILLASATPRFSTDGSIVGSVVMIVDINDRKRAERALRNAKREWEDIFQAIGHPAIIMDLDHKIVAANRSAMEVSGKSVNELLNSKCYELFHKSDEPPEGCPMEALLKSGLLHTVEMEMEALGRHYLVSCTPLSGEDERIQRFIHVATDITDRKKSEKALLDSEERYRHITENSLTGIFLYQDGRSVYSNKRLAEMVGYTSEELLSKPFLEAIHPDDRPMVSKMAEARLSGQPVPKQYELRLLHKSGRTVWTEVLAHRIDYQGHPAILGNVADVTQRRVLEQKLNQLQKMEAISTLTGGIAHDFNNLLTIINGYTELILSEKTEDDPNYSDLENILETGRKGAGLVRKLMAFSKTSEIMPQPLNLNLIVEDSCSIMQSTFPKTIEIESLLAEDLAIVQADANHMAQVLMNLCINAKEAMPEGGSLYIETRNVTVDDDYSRLHDGAIPGRYVLIEVSDTGHGINRETMDRMFDPFFTTKGWDFNKGTGLGLSVAMGLVERHDGWISCESELGKGTSFKVYLPAIEADLQAEAETTGVMPAFGTETVLLVDDERFVRELGARMLTKQGYTVLEAENGREALNIFQKESSCISLVILDLDMPELTGADCLKDLLKIDPNVKVLVASGYSADSSLTETVQVGTKGFLNKPFRYKELLRKVRRVLEEGCESS